MIKLLLDSLTARVSDRRFIIFYSDKKSPHDFDYNQSLKISTGLKQAVHSLDLVIMGCDCVERII